jgi:hypothetical protein
VLIVKHARARRNQRVSLKYTRTYKDFCRLMLMFTVALAKKLLVGTPELAKGECPVPGFRCA